MVNNTVLQLGGQAPLVAVIAGIIAILLLLVVLDLPAFVSLVVAGFTVGLVAPAIAFADVPGEFATAFGDNMAGIGIPILMAAIIGKAMVESGAANRIVRAFTSLFGEDNTEISLFGSSFIMSVPVFFDNVFYLLAPLARSARARDGKNYALYIVAMGAAGVVTHGFVPPTPGPLLAVDRLEADLGSTILIGILVGFPTALISGLGYGYWINKRIEIPLRDTMGTTVEELEEQNQIETHQLPGLLESLLPILLAVLLVTADTTTQTVLGEDAAVGGITGFFGDPNLALTVAALAAAFTYYRMSDLDSDAFSDELTDALKSGGNIAAITAAGGAFGAMLQAAGAGEYIANGLEGVGFGLIVTAWVIAAGVRLVQGSATVAIVTTAGIMAPLASGLDVNTAYLVMSIGAGASFCSWYNDSGFWIVKEIGGLTQAETLKTWTVATTLIGIVGLLSTLVFSTILPLA
ncbi:GntP family permease [Haloterrigena sp. SYSU A121-1]|uniref:GntP family permease n=1 Tax=Haloterrigena gelatinilytica TaxID=2741724 RepID=A0A8J8KHC5_9EURY|nr:gluconate:H+ symporter [Haloterrigena gelatinilytica]NUB93386.1 GntP family permease [Haloterrigena gelatinilytica]